MMNFFIGVQYISSSSTLPLVTHNSGTVSELNSMLSCPLSVEYQKRIYDKKIFNGVFFSDYVCTYVPFEFAALYNEPKSTSTANRSSSMLAGIGIGILSRAATAYERFFRNAMTY